jgi:hypothetical protein
MRFKTFVFAALSVLVTGLMMTSTLKADEQTTASPNFGTLFTNAVYMTFELAIPAAENGPEALVTEAKDAAQRLSRLTGDSMTAHIAFYNPHVGAAAVAFSSDGTWAGQVASVIMTASERMMVEQVYRMQVMELRERTVSRLDGSVYTRVYPAFVALWKTTTDIRATRPEYESLATCLSRREGAERLVGQDPDKVVFWSTCHEVNDGFYLKVHYVNREQTGE